jgi:hypothetical protein
MHRHEDSENRSPGETIAFHNTTMIPNDLSYQSKTEASPARFGRHEGVEEVAHQVGRNAWPIVLDAKFERKSNTRLRSRHGHADTRPECRCQLNLGIILINSNGFCGILHKV